MIPNVHIHLNVHKKALHSNTPSPSLLISFINKKTGENMTDDRTNYKKYSNTLKLVIII